MKILFKASIILFIVLGMSSCISEQLGPSVDCSLNPVEVSIIELINPECGPNGSFIVEAIGGEPPYTYFFEGESNSEGSFSNIAAGNYSVTATDVNGCSAQESIAITNLSGVNIENILTNQAGCGTEEGSIEISVFGGTEPYSYALNDETPQTSNIFSGLSNGIYNLIITDNTGCQTEESIEILSGVSYDTDVKIILETNCVISGCHNGSTLLPDWSNKENAIARALNIERETSSRRMPLVGSLTQDEIDLIACWVNDGAPNN